MHYPRDNKLPFFVTSFSNGRGWLSELFANASAFSSVSEKSFREMVILFFISS